MNLPNKLTLLRIIAIPVFIVVLLLGYRYTATIIFIAAALTDICLLYTSHKERKAVLL